jgi:hypothetical protein
MTVKITMEVMVESNSMDSKFGSRSYQSIKFCLTFTFTFKSFVLTLERAATPIRTRERRRLKAVCPHNPSKQHCFLTQCPLNPKASHTNVSEETPYTWWPCQRACPWPATGVARARWDKDIPAGQTLPYPRRRWANCAPPHGSPGRGRLWQSLDSNQDLEPGSLVAQLALRCSALNHCGGLMHLYLKHLNRFPLAVTWGQMLHVVGADLRPV